MSFFAPIESALPAVEGMLSTAATLLRPALGIGAAVTVGVLFRPLFVGLWQTLVIIVKPRETLEQRLERRRYKSALLLNRLADENSLRQPNLAAELRNFASRD
ncbi:MAG: hypothetical protein JWP38_3644 [Herbaspirillum sp.]|nr:hypothetical protein [Herbaspirillum sp.]